MADRAPHDPPSPFIAAWVRRVDPAGARRALDVAMGRGRHALLLAAQGFRVFGVDRLFDATRDTVRAGRTRDVHIRGWCADLTATPLPPEHFQLIVVTRYLQRDLFAGLARSLSPGGVILYETFTTRQRVHRRGPTSDDHLLQEGELRRAFASLDEMFYEEVEEPDAVARLAASKRW